MTDRERIQILRRRIQRRLDQGWGNWFDRMIARLYLRLTDHPRYR